MFGKEKSATQLSTGFMYLDLMRLLHQIRTAVQTNDFDMKLDAWNKMLPCHFAFNQTNYTSMRRGMSNNERN